MKSLKVGNMRAEIKIKKFSDGLHTGNFVFATTCAVYAINLLPYALYVR
jgi:hypothetical protein